MTRKNTLTKLCIAFGLAALIATPAIALEIVSVDSDGNQGAGDSDGSYLSEDGRYVAFHSENQLVPEDTDSTRDAYRHDRETGETILISKGHEGGSADMPARVAGISADGQRILVYTGATNILPTQPYSGSQLYVYDWEEDKVMLVSRHNDGTAANNSPLNPVMSRDGNFVGFNSLATNLVDNDTEGQKDVFFHEVDTGKTVRISEDGTNDGGNGSSGNPGISYDGEYVVFSTSATNFSSGDSNTGSDIYLYTVATGDMERLTMADGGGEPDGIHSHQHVSIDGRYVTFRSTATNLLPVGEDTNGEYDIYRIDRNSGNIERISLAFDGSQTDGDVNYLSVSTDGSKVLYTSAATNVVEDDMNGNRDAFLLDLDNGETKRVSKTSTGAEGDGVTFRCNISASGKVYSFISSATNLATTDTNGTGQDVFVASSAPDIDPDIALRAKLLKKIKKLKRKLKKARRKGNVKRKKRLRKRIRKLRKRVRRL